MMALTAEDLRGLVLVRDCLGADGGFIVAHALKLGLGLDGGHSVLLVAARHTAPHYAMALRKAGVHLPQLVAAGRAAVVDAMRPAPGQAPAAQLTDLRALHRGMGKAAADLAQGQRPLLVVIDDLTTLHCAADRLDEWPAFLHAATTAHRGGSGGGCTLALAHGDVADDAPWLSRLEHAASVVVEVSALETGHSAEVRGRVRLCRRLAPRQAGGAAAAGGGGGIEARLGPEEWHYRAAESGVQFVRQVHS